MAGRVADAPTSHDSLFPIAKPKVKYRAKSRKKYFSSAGSAECCEGSAGYFLRKRSHHPIPRRGSPRRGQGRALASFSYARSPAVIFGTSLWTDPFAKVVPSFRGPSPYHEYDEDFKERLPVSIGLIALLDDVAAIAKVAAASLDDVASQAARAGIKAAGVVIDDAAVTPRYVVGFAAQRELPIVGKIAAGSLRNKLMVLLPAALLLSYFLPFAITPLLMLGGAYLCYEGVEKIYQVIVPQQAHSHEAHLEALALNARTLEEQKIASAIKTDFILSAEIMAITLAAIPESGILMQAAVLAIVGIGITAAVYGVVALTVKADDVGVALAKNDSDSAMGGLSRGLGRALVRGMPVFLIFLSAAGTAAMIWVGGGIILHGLEAYGLPSIARTIHGVAETAAHALPPLAGVVEWIVTAAGSGITGLLIGAVLIPLVGSVFAPALRLVKRVLRRAQTGFKS
jgi:uncharacterized protein